MTTQQTWTAPSGLLFNPDSEDFLRNRYAAYARLRETEPVYRSPLGFWVVTRNSDVRSILSDNRFGKNFGSVIAQRFGLEVLEEPALKMCNNQVIFRNLPDHRRLRTLLQKAFTAREVQSMRPRIQEFVNQLIDGVQEAGTMDVVKDFALRVPVMVICDLLGITGDQHVRYLMTRLPSRLLDPAPISRDELRQINGNVLELTDFVGEICKMRRREPRKDLISTMVQAEEEGQILSEEELVANIILMFGAGYETTATLISNAVLLLNQHPEQRDRLKADRSLMADAVEEALRYEAPVQLAGRTALEDVTVSDVPIPRGESVVVVLGAANRDPEIFRDPEAFDISRTDNRQMAFGGGIHFCLGAQLSRIEADIALNTLLQRLPGMEIEALEDPPWRKSFVFRSLTHLTARWSPERAREATARFMAQV